MKIEIMKIIEIGIFISKILNNEMKYISNNIHINITQYFYRILE